MPNHKNILFLCQEPSPLLIKAAENIYNDVKFPVAAPPEPVVMIQPVVEAPEKPVKKVCCFIHNNIACMKWFVSPITPTKKTFKISVLFSHSGLALQFFII